MMQGAISRKLEVQEGPVMRAESVKERVRGQIEDLERRLAAQKELSELLENHPEIERAFTLFGNIY